MSRTTKSDKPKKRSVSLPTPADFRAYLREKAMLIAPGDISTALGQREEALEKASLGGDNHPRLQRQTEVALELLGDHEAGRCPQVPYHTISLLGVAVLYLLNPVDVIPDWIPGLGISDDALVLELAFEIGAAGVERYCTWKGISTETLFTKKKSGNPR
jgi:uncharacterized membrane protein YkvA (DUF1232 family)